MADVIVYDCIRSRLTEAHPFFKLVAIAIWKLIVTGADVGLAVNVGNPDGLEVGYKIGWLDGWQNGWCDGWEDGWIVGCIDGWTDG